MTKPNPSDSTQDLMRELEEEKAKVKAKTVEREEAVRTQIRTSAELCSVAKTISDSRELKLNSKLFKSQADITKSLRPIRCVCPKNLGICPTPQECLEQASKTVDKDTN